jgi:drug/metabolite transporter (DMT)-like permease
MLQTVRKRSNPSSAVMLSQQTEGTPLLPSDKIEGSDAARPVYTAATGVPASLYVLSGVTQPLLMTLCKNAGLADPNCQLYMLFYYLGPASVGLLMLNQAHEDLPSLAMTTRAGCISLVDIAAQAMNYTGAALAGPTIFAIVYSSVTVWTAVLSRILLRRQLIPGQWVGIVTVFAGLALTATDHSVQVGGQVARGLVLVMMGSALHGLCYVMGEIVMVVPEQVIAELPLWLQTLMGDKHARRLSVIQNCALQGFFALTFMFTWQLFYTLPHAQELILEPMHQAGTTHARAALIFGLFATANLVHALTYFFTLRHFPGGATSAGVMKGLQAVLVFAATAYLYCGNTGGTEMCFSPTKFSSLVTVVGGVALFGFYTEKQHREKLLLRQQQQQQQQQQGSQAFTTTASMNA